MYTLTQCHPAHSKHKAHTHNQVELWGLAWTRETSKEGKPLLVTVLPDERAYERFMGRFDADDSVEVRFVLCVCACVYV